MPESTNVINVPTEICDIIELVVLLVNAKLVDSGNRVYC